LIFHVRRVGRAAKHCSSRRTDKTTATTRGRRPGGFRVLDAPAACEARRGPGGSGGLYTTPTHDIEFLILISDLALSGESLEAGRGGAPGLVAVDQLAVQVTVGAGLVPVQEPRKPNDVLAPAERLPL
jgi:hypothetical protein